ncbi:YrhK family protein [Saliterribacillus persicus]|uniref:YrhK-like protein n=1 Tax=Saliterribacillus persicus TaxID=930114 RepID=A0A368YAL1_9BACI|nr:YrhK family protein [Saliterribacillus persicus]RCW77301.1 YrhK-like protein [Saliterribacillus persicus]
MPSIKDGEEYIDVKAGRFRLYLNKRYQVFSTINDMLIGILFVLGSILNFWSSLEMEGMIAYLLGSIFLVVRPVLRLINSATLRDEIKSKDTYTT